MWRFWGLGLFFFCAVGNYLFCGFSGGRLLVVSNVVDGSVNGDLVSSWGMTMKPPYPFPHTVIPSLNGVPLHTFLVPLCMRFMVIFWWHLWQKPRLFFLCFSSDGHHLPTNPQKTLFISETRHQTKVFLAKTNKFLCSPCNQLLIFYYFR